MKVNFHTHTAWSDGYLTFLEGLHLALDQELSWWGPQDHDRAMAWSKQNIAETSKYVPIESVSRGLLQSGQLKIPQGMELTVNDNGIEIHLGSLFIDHPDKEFDEYLKQIELYRWDRIKAMAKAVDIDMQRVNAEVGIGIPCRLYLGYIKYLEEMQKPPEQRDPEITCAREAMDKYVGPKTKDYVSFDVDLVYTPEKGIQKILQLGGIPFWNHSKRTCKQTGLILRETYERYNEYAGGKLAMEVEDPLELEAMLNKYDVVVVGNDFHAFPYDPETKPLAVDIPDDLGAEMIRRLEKAYNATTK